MQNTGKGQPGKRHGQKVESSKSFDIYSPGTGRGGRTGTDRSELEVQVKYQGQDARVGSIRKINIRNSYRKY